MLQLVQVESQNVYLSDTLICSTLSDKFFSRVIKCSIPELEPLTSVVGDHRRDDSGQPPKLQYVERDCETASLTRLFDLTFIPDLH